MEKGKKNNNIATKWVIIIFAAVLVCSIVITNLMAASEKQVKNIGVATYTSLVTDETEDMVLLADNSSKSKKMANILETLKLEGNVEYYSIDTTKLSSSDMGKITKSSSLLSNVKAPAIIHISSGEVIGVYNGDANQDDIESFGTVFKSLTVSQYNDLAKEDTEHYIFIGRPTCIHCVSSMPIIKRVAYDLNKDIYYLNIDNETSASLQDLATYTGGIYDGSTPLFLITKNGQVTNHKTGESTVSDFIDFFSGKASSK